VGKFLDAPTAVPAKTDVIVLPEVITLVGTKKKAMDVAEPVPGPTTARLVEVARQRNTYIVASLYEKDGHAIYNTAVLIGRKGEIVGKYRKVYLPYDEPDDGVTPGSDYPVFQTDFGKVGMAGIPRIGSACVGPQGRGNHPHADLGRPPDPSQSAEKETVSSWSLRAMAIRSSGPAGRDPGICDPTGFSGGCHD
jgi:hypothetical protein